MTEREGEVEIAAASARRSIDEFRAALEGQAGGRRHNKTLTVALRLRRYG